MAVSPMMKQYQDAKASCQGAILLFRMGDFYEMFFEDARTAARVLNLALTSREKGENAIPMAGFPYHQLESYLGKLVAAGLRVAVCDQVEDARQAKGLVRRDVTRIVSAGTLTDESLLDPRASNYLAAIVPTEPAGMAWIDLSTGSFRAACFPLARLADELARIAAAEVLVADDERLAAAAGQRQPACHAAARPGRLPRKRRRSRWPGISTSPRSKVLVSTTPTCRPSARPAPCWSIWSKRRNRRWPTSTAWNITAPAIDFRSTKRRAAAWN